MPSLRFFTFVCGLFLYAGLTSWPITTQASSVRPPKVISEANGGHVFSYPLYLDSKNSNLQYDLILKTGPQPRITMSPVSTNVVTFEVLVEVSGFEDQAKQFSMAKWHVDSFEYLDFSRVAHQLEWSEKVFTSLVGMNVRETVDDFKKEVVGLLSRQLLFVSEVFARGPIYKIKYPEFFASKLVTRGSLLDFYNTHESVKLERQPIGDDPSVRERVLFSPGFAEVYFHLNPKPSHMGWEHFVALMQHQAKDILQQAKERLIEQNVQLGHYKKRFDELPYGVPASCKGLIAKTSAPGL